LKTLATPANTDRTWRFGVFEVDTRREELRRSGSPVKMREQSFRILVYLLEHPGEIVTREELRQVLWPSDTFVDFDHSLNTAVMKLREALGDSTGAPLYIETIPKRGYRFIAPLSRNADSAVDVGEADLRKMPGTENLKLGEESAQAASSPRSGRPITVIALVVALILVAAVGGLLFQRSRANHAAAQGAGSSSSAFKIVPITSASGNTIFPSFSPDGREIAFIWDGPQLSQYDVYAQLVGADMPLRLTYNKSGLLGAPAWSPDGSEIAFTRCDGKNDGVYVVPALGGSERKLTAVGCYYVPGPLAWLSDGKAMLMIDRCLPARTFGIVLFSMATGEKRCLTNSSLLKNVDVGLWFALSPDGNSIAFTPAPASGQFDIYTVPLSGGEPQRLTTSLQLDCSTFADRNCIEFMWTPDGRSIVFVSHRTTLPSMWRLSTNDGQIEHEAIYPAIGSFSKDGHRLVYSEETATKGPEIWRADLASAGGDVVSNQTLIQSQFPELDAQPSPDGTRIVWMSCRTGNCELRVSDAKGANPVQFTQGGGGTPRWSPDGRWIAFDRRTGNDTQIFVVDSDGRNLHSITDGASDNVVPSWSRDGKSIYFTSNRTGTWQVFKHSLATGGEVQLTRNGGFYPFESFDEKTIYFSRFDQAGIWSLPVSGGAESLVIADKPQVGYWGHWAITTAGLYFLNMDAEPGPRIEFYNFGTRRISPVLKLQRRPPRLQPSLGATPDGRTLYYTQLDYQSVIKMMEISQ
jgi:Tol biopolymer transport system component/DNA-binding winged helix-turn-helix (wHTH) protein